MNRFLKAVAGILDDREKAPDGTKVSTRSLDYNRFMHNVTARKPKIPFYPGGKSQTGVSRKLGRELWLSSKSDAMQKRRT